MNLPVEKLDWAFVNHRGRAPSPAELIEWNEQMGRYARVQQLLASAAGSQSPFHDGQASFWQLPYVDFMALPPIYDVRLIADRGQNRGARSGLVKVLKGEQSGIPQMPLNRPPMNPEDIQFIQDWIDDDCPEN